MSSKPVDTSNHARIWASSQLSNRASEKQQAQCHDGTRQRVADHGEACGQRHAAGSLPRGLR
ncbi:MAG: hypothetical protein NVV63_00015 [Opitutus sp.]|nr:hypothetical protein [Opitutus sp.]